MLHYYGLPSFPPRSLRVRRLSRLTRRCSTQADALQPDGGIGLMFYGTLGRIGVYHAQQMLRMLAPRDSGDSGRVAAPAAREADRTSRCVDGLTCSRSPEITAARAEAADMIRLARRLVRQLPESNWLRIDPWRWQQARVAALHIHAVRPQAITQHARALPARRPLRRVFCSVITIACRATSSSTSRCRSLGTPVWSICSCRRWTFPSQCRR